MIDWYGPPADVRPSAGVGDKMSSLADRLDEWRPLLYMSRFFAWNNLLLVPLALIGLWRMGWRAAFRGERIALPLGLGALGMAVLTISPGYGWGYRYLHGFIGSFALLAGLGWASLKQPDQRVLTISVLIALLMASFLMMRADDYVAPYAKAHRRILQSGADVVLVDPARWALRDRCRARAGKRAAGQPSRHEHRLAKWMSWTGCARTRTSRFWTSAHSRH